MTDSAENSRPANVVFPQPITCGQCARDAQRFEGLGLKISYVKTFPIKESLGTKIEGSQYK